MEKILLAMVAAAGAAFAALASADLGAAAGTHLASVNDGWWADAVAQSCRIDKRWRRDYGGQLYLRKVRICA